MIHFAYLVDHLCSHIGVGAEAHTPFFDIGATDVEFYGRNVVQLIDHCSCFAIFFY